MKATSSPATDAGRLSGLVRFAIRVSWPFRPGLLDAAWAAFSAINLVAIVAFPGWETIPFYAIWISFTLLYGFRTWAPRPTLWVLAGVMAATAGGIGLDVARGAEPGAQLTEVPLMAAMFLAMVWHARRKQAAEHESRLAEHESRLVGEENARLLATQRRFLQDASHQLRTPITIALGHAELLARALVGRQEGHDIQVVLGELNRLRRIAERLLVIAAAEGPEFLRLEPVALDSFTMEILRRWRPTANRRWQLGRLDKATVQADRERLSLAVDALLENAVRHTADDDIIKLSVVSGPAGAPGSPESLVSSVSLASSASLSSSAAPASLASLAAPVASAASVASASSASSASSVRMIVADSGQGIPPELLRHIFDRFRSGDSGHPRGTGLGLALVRAVARAHGGDVRVHSRPGQGSEFELLLPAPSGPPALLTPPPAVVDAGGGKLARKP